MTKLSSNGKQWGARLRFWSIQHSISRTLAIPDTVQVYIQGLSTIMINLLGIAVQCREREEMASHDYKLLLSKQKTGDCPAWWHTMSGNLQVPLETNFSFLATNSLAYWPMCLPVYQSAGQLRAKNPSGQQYLWPWRLSGFWTCSHARILWKEMGKADIQSPEMALWLHRTLLLIDL